MADITREQLAAFVHDRWETDVIPRLHDYVLIPNVSPAFDPAWDDAGHMDRATTLIEEWCRSRPVAGLTVERHTLPGRTPVLLVEVPATAAGHTDTVLLYGHLDKQPEMAGWRDGLGPWTPVREGNRLYGRAVADDGYSVFAALTAIEALQEAGRPHARCVVLIEASEESGSPDLPPYIDALAERIGQPSLVIALDSGGASFDRLWVTTSLRGLTDGNLRVEVVEHGVHSGTASGVVPSSFRIMRRLLDRIEDAATGDVRLPEMHVPIPEHVRTDVERLVADLGHPPGADLPLVGGMQLTTDDAVELELNGTWRPALSVIGVEGIPPLANAGNVLRPFTTLRLSMRLPPTADADAAAAALQRALTADPPYGATVTFTPGATGAGWAAPPAEPWLAAALDDASTAAFGRPAASIGVGGSIPFMAMLGHRFPQAQFVITGVLGPDTSEHGPNEYLDLAMGEGVTRAIATVVAAHAERGR
jgi:acetylornithine deacetylase/succinyl-diaminopimelate desuccinylase-like protein